MKKTFPLYFLALVLCSCSSRVHHTEQVDRPSSPIDHENESYEWLAKTCHYKNQDWATTTHNFECINKITFSIESLLSSGNSPLALKTAKLGATRFPFDNRIANQLQKSLEVYKNSTFAMSQNLPLDCGPIFDRIEFLKAISPDSILNIEACPYHRDEHAILKLKGGLVETHLPKTDRALEQNEFNNISSLLSYTVKKNNEDNSAYLIYKGISTINLNLASFQFETPHAMNDQRFNLIVYTEVTGSFDPKGVCDELSDQFYFPRGQRFKCEGITHRNSDNSLVLGKKDFDILTELEEKDLLTGGIFPVTYIYDVTFRYRNSTKVYYYLVTMNQDEFVPYNAETPELSALDNIRYDEGITSGFNGSFMFKNLNKSQVEHLESITLNFNQQLTYELFLAYLKTNAPFEDAWKWVVKRNLDKPNKSH